MLKSAPLTLTLELPKTIQTLDHSSQSPHCNTLLPQGPSGSCDLPSGQGGLLLVRCHRHWPPVPTDGRPQWLSRQPRSSALIWKSPEPLGLLSRELLLTQKVLLNFWRHTEIFPFFPLTYFLLLTFDTGFPVTLAARTFFLLSWNLSPRPLLIVV